MKVLLTAGVLAHLGLSQTFEFDPNLFEEQAGDTDINEDNSDKGITEATTF